jgi:hypothetical protein
VTTVAASNVDVVVHVDADIHVVHGVVIVR